MTTTTCPACELLPEDARGDADSWCCGSCGDQFTHDEGVHDVQYGTYHEFTCKACLAVEALNG